VSDTDENSVYEEICIVQQENETFIDLKVINLPQNGLISTLNSIYIKEQSKCFEADSVDTDKFQPTL